MKKLYALFVGIMCSIGLSYSSEDLMISNLMQELLAKTGVNSLTINEKLDSPEIYSGVLQAAGETFNMSPTELNHVQPELIEITTVAKESLIALTNGNMSQEDFGLFLRMSSLCRPMFVKQNASEDEIRTCVLNLGLGLTLIKSGPRPVYTLLKKMMTLGKISPEVARKLNILVYIAISLPANNDIQELCDFLLNTCKIDTDEIPLMHVAIKEGSSHGIQSLLNAGSCPYELDEVGLLETVRKCTHPDKRRQVVEALLPWIDFEDKREAKNRHINLMVRQQRSIESQKPILSAIDNGSLPPELQNLVLKFAYGDKYDRSKVINKLIGNKNKNNLKSALFFTCASLAAFYFDDSYIGTYLAFPAVMRMRRIWNDNWRDNDLALHDTSENNSNLIPLLCFACICATAYYCDRSIIGTFLILQLIMAIDTMMCCGDRQSTAV